MASSCEALDLSCDLINPISVARAFLEKVKALFPLKESSSAIRDLEEQVADKLVEKFAKITSEYEIVEENENSFDGSVSDSMERFSVGDPQEWARCWMESDEWVEPEEDTENQADSPYDESFMIPPKKAKTTVEQKARILKAIDENPNWSMKTVMSKYGSLKHRNYIPIWRQQVKNGGTINEIFHKIHQHVLEKFTECRSVFKPVHDIDIRRWAIERAAEFPSIRRNFKASLRWVSYFKKTHRIVSRKVTKIVSKRNLREMDEILANVEEFRKEILAEQKNYPEENILNTDQIPFNYEYVSERTLANKGEKVTFGAAFSPGNATTHSFTSQLIISAAGRIVGPMLVCLQEPSGMLGPQVRKTLFKASNLVVTCSKSGKMSKSHSEYFFKTVALPQITGDVLYTLDSWTGHLNLEAYNDTGDHNVKVKVIPKNGTSLAQPLDVYFNRELKYFVKRLAAYANITDNCISSRNNVLKVQCLAHFTLSSPVFYDLIRYSWIKSGLVDLERKPFKNVRDACFSFKEKECMHVDCNENAFYKCPWCEKVICFDHLFNKMHAFECPNSPVTES